MCSIDILESMVSISSIINKLSLDRFELFNKNNLMLLGKVEFASSEGKEKHDVKLSEPDDDIYNSVKDVFLKIISLTSKDDSPAIRESVHNIYLYWVMLFLVFRDIKNPFWIRKHKK